MSSIIERPWSEEAFRDIRSGTYSEQSNQTDSSATSEGTKSEKTHAGGEQECMDMFPVTLGETISPFYMIICDICGEEMDNDLICPRCKREMPGHLIHYVCQYCDDYPAGHKSDSCPRKDK